MKELKNIYDGYKSNDKKRSENINLLEENGFVDGGVYCSSGSFSLQVLDNGQGKIIFGKSCNIGGKKSNKYFALVKYYENKKEATRAFKSLAKKLNICK